MSTNPTPGNRLRYGVIERNTPAWMKTAPTATHKALRSAFAAAPAAFKAACLQFPEVVKALAQEHERYRTSSLAAQGLFASLPNLEAFASEQLAAAIKQQFKLELDVSSTYLFDAVGYAPLRQMGRGKPEDFVRSLKHHALQNFEASATEAGGMDVPTPNMRSAILDQRGYGNGPPFDNVVAIEPTAFAALCRKLDLGGQYQALIDNIYYPSLSADSDASWTARFAAQKPVLDTLGQVELSAFRQSVHCAFLQGLVGRTAYDAILTTSLESLDKPAQASARFSFLTLWGTELNAMVLIQLKCSPTVVLYTPHATDSPLREYPSLTALKQQLRNAIQQDLSVITRHMPDAQKAQLASKVQDHLMPLTFTLKNTYERVADPTAVLPLAPRAFNRPFCVEMLYQNFTRLRDDARYHAVPTLAMNARTFKARLAYFESIALGALNVVGFIVPEVGYLLLAATILHLGNEVYEGIESWANDDRQQAFAYLLDVLENVAFLAISTAAGHVIKAELSGPVQTSGEGSPAPGPSPVETPSFIEELIEVELPDGNKRLWKPDLTPYEQQPVFPSSLAPDELGLRRHGGKLWLQLDGKAYSLKHSAETGTYRIEHPGNPRAYGPALRHNGYGAWLHDLDLPREWPALRLFKRLGYRAERFNDEDAARILEVSGIDDGTLRRVVSESQPLPAPLVDTLERFRLDREMDETLPSLLRRSVFTENYRRLPAIQAPGAAVLQRIYKDLPNAFVEELLRHADSAELQSLITGRVPRRIGEEARLMQQQVRLMRAYEGLYLRSVDNPDTDRLVLHSLPRLPGWSSDTAIELHRGRLPASRVDGLGPEGTDARIITHTPQGYQLTAEAAYLPDTTHSSLYQALFAALPEIQRQALVPAGITDADTLAERIQQAPLLPRWALRKALNMQRPGPRSPMRLADGRLGYRLSGGGQLPEEHTRSALLSRLDDMALSPAFALSSERILMALESAELSPAQIQSRIEQLLAEHQELRQSLDEAFAGRGQIPGLGALIANRQAIEIALWQHWTHSAIPELGEPTGTLRLSRMFIAEFPHQLPVFIGSRVQRLQLDNIWLDYSNDGSLHWTQYEAQLSNLFQHFPSLSALEIERDHDAVAAASELASCLPLIVSSFPRLSELRLVNQNLTLYPLDLDRFATREHLRHLDLSGNRFAPFAIFSFPDMYLEHFGLDRMGLDQWPSWLDGSVLPRIGTLSLQDNNLVRVPDTLTADVGGTTERTLIRLEGNPLHPARQLDLYRSQAVPLRRFDFSLSTTRIIEEYQGLREAIDAWRNPAQPLLEQAARARNQVGQSILAFWERRVRDDTISPWQLETFRQEDFPPVLPAFFAPYVDIVRLNRVQLTTVQLDQWLRRFPYITHLVLDGHIHPLRGLPEALTGLQSLTRLSLLNQGLEVDRRAMDLIAHIPALRELDLSGNMLSDRLRNLNAPPRRLDRLALRNVGMERWPDWLLNLMPRFTLDLRENRLTTLPRAVLDNPRTAYGSVALLLSENPLTNDTMRAAHLSQHYDRSFTFDMDLPLDILMASPQGTETGNAFGSSLGSLGSTASSGSSHGHGYAPWATLLELDVTPWLEGSAGLRQARSSQWQRLRDGGEAENLLQLVTQLTTSVPYRNTDSRPALIERVWRVLDMAANQARERELFEGIAEEAIAEGTCPDGMLLQFQQVEQKHLIALAALETSGEHRESSLYRLLRRLFRQQRLDEIASAKSLHQDAAEVRLAYRRLLAERLDLLTQPDEMMFGADVSSEDATNAALRIWEDEEGGDFLTFATSTPFWIDYLRDAYADAFAQIESKFQSAVNNLQYDHPEASLAELEAPTRALEAQRDQQVDNLITELTSHIRANHR
ncbi:NEL-type E3 ubiquitin ligase domain-containing protein [Pseudomonas mosselii]